MRSDRESLLIFVNCRRDERRDGVGGMGTGRQEARPRHLLPHRRQALPRHALHQSPSRKGLPRRQWVVVKVSALMLSASSVNKVLCFGSTRKQEMKGTGKRIMKMKKKTICRRRSLYKRRPIPAYAGRRPIHLVPHSFPLSSTLSHPFCAKPLHLVVFYRS